MTPKHSSLKNKGILHNRNIIIIPAKIIYKPYLNFLSCPLQQDQIECTAFDSFLLAYYICIIRLFIDKKPFKNEHVILLPGYSRQHFTSPLLLGIYY